MQQPAFNLHNHTPFSDGAYSIDELCEAHLRLSDVPVAGIGICDHLFCTPSSRQVKSEREFDRLFGEETRRYVEAVHDARRRWRGRMQIFCGAEINWPLNRNMLDHVRARLVGIDYLLFEHLDWAGLTQLANQAKRFPCPVGIAHTDVAESFPATSMDQVVRTLANARIFYEINSKMAPFEGQGAWLALLPRHRVQVTVGTDTHDDLDCIRQLGAMQQLLRRYGLVERMLVPAPREEAAIA